MRRFAVPAVLFVTFGVATPAVAAAGQARELSAAATSGFDGRALADALGASAKKASWSGSSTSRLDRAAADAKAARSRHAADASLSARARAAASADVTIYVADPSELCTSESGNDGSSAHPYCSIQDAVNAAAPGDTVSVAGQGTAGYDYAGVTIKTSDLTLVGTGSGGTFVGGPLSITGASGITLSGLIFQDQVYVGKSADDLIDSDEFTGVQTARAVTIDSTASDVTVSRSMVNAQSSTDTAILVVPGASKIDIASNAFAPFSGGAVAANGVTGITVVGNTIQRGCGSGVVLTGTTTGAYIENNVLEDANADVDSAHFGGLKATCTAAGSGWSPDITVDSTAAAGTTSDYNDFYTWGADGTAAYSWAGTAYSTSDLLDAAVAQGSHDTIDTAESAAIDPNPFGWGDPIQAALQPGSAAIGSANAAAPGALTSDLYGVAPYSDRGAVAVDSDDVTVSATVTPQMIEGIDTALTLQVDPTGSGTYKIWQYDVDWGDGTSGPSVFLTHTYAQAGTYPITVTAVDTHGRTASTTIQATVAGSDYTPYGPVRVLDTRNGTGAALGAVAAHGTVKLKVAGAGETGDPIPSGITAVVMNVTAVTPTSNGVLTVYPDQGPQGQGQIAPGTSNLNFLAGQTVPNLVTVPVGPNGVVDLYNNAAGSTQFLADVVGYFQQKAASQYVSVVPYRILDTRNAVGVRTKTSIPANGSVSISVEYVGQQMGDPNDIATVTAVAVNLTAINGSANGVITAYPTGQNLPTASNVNYPARTNIANMAIVPVGSGGQITFHNNSSGTVDLAADLDGYFTTTTGFTPVPDTTVDFNPSAYVPMATPYRWLDTRAGNGELAGGNSYAYPFTDNAHIDGVVLNATVVAPTANGFLALFPEDVSPTQPNVSNINFLAGRNAPNMVIVSPGNFEDPGGKYYIAAYLNGKGTANLVADVFGIFEDE